MSFLNKTEICRLHFEEGIPQSALRKLPICENLRTGKPISYKTLGDILGSNRISLTSKVKADSIDVKKLNEMVSKGYSLYSIQQEFINNKTGKPFSASVLNRFVTNRPAVKLSYLESSIRKLLDEHNVKYVTNDRSVIKPLELDIYIPDANFAIELNGNYWHKGSTKGKYYHKNKFFMCKDKGISLFQFREDTFNNKQDIVKATILSKIGLSKRIYARKCNVVAVDSKTEKLFMTNNHIQGYCPSSIKYGLEHEGQLVMVISIVKSRFNKSFQWELIRACSLKGVTVVGGLSKLFSHFVKSHNPDSVILYSNLFHGSGESYLNLGFTEYGYSEPSYIWYNFKEKKALTRLQTQKHKLKDLFPAFYKSELSERAIMESAGYSQIFDSGCLQYSWFKS